MNGDDVNKLQNDLGKIEVRFNQDGADRDMLEQALGYLRGLLRTDIEAKEEIFYKSKDEVEALLFELTEDGLIPTDKFQEFYEKLSNMDSNTALLGKLYKEIKAYESK